VPEIGSSQDKKSWLWWTANRDFVTENRLMQLKPKRTHITFLLTHISPCGLFSSQFPCLHTMPLPMLIRTHSLFLVSYRLCEIFQSWAVQFVLGGTSSAWQSRNVHRSLVLVFAGYYEVTISYAIFAWTLRGHFYEINNWKDAFYHSVRNMIAIGGNAPIDSIGYWLFSTQILFVLLFLTAVVSRVISRSQATE